MAVLLGDGALMFSVQELVTLVEQRLPVPVVVVDNGGYQEIRDQQAAREIPPDRRRAAHAGPGRAGRGHGRPRGAHHRRSTDLTGLVSRRARADGPTLVHLDLR